MLGGTGRVERIATDAAEKTLLFAALVFPRVHAARFPVRAPANSGGCMCAGGRGAR